MPIIKSSIKDIRRIKTRTLRNRAEMSSVRTAIKAVRSAKTTDEASAKLKIAMKVLAKARSHNVLKANTASRLIGRLSSAVHKMQKASAK